MYTSLKLLELKVSLMHAAFVNYCWMFPVQLWAVGTSPSSHVVAQMGAIPPRRQVWNEYRALHVISNDVNSVEQCQPRHLGLIIWKYLHYFTFFSPLSFEEAEAQDLPDLAQPASISASLSPSLPLPLLWFHHFMASRSSQLTFVLLGTDTKSMESNFHPQSHQALAQAPLTVC